MPDFVLAIILRPFVLLLISVLFLIPGRLAVQRWLPDGRITRVIMWQIPNWATPRIWTLGGQKPLTRPEHLNLPWIGLSEPQQSLGLLQEKKNNREALKDARLPCGGYKLH